MTGKTNHHGKKHFCQYSLQCISSSKALQYQKKHCTAINHTKSVLLPKEDAYINFPNFKRLMHNFKKFQKHQKSLSPNTCFQAYCLQL